jgi:hypothetical protein
MGPVLAYLRSRAAAVGGMLPAALLLLYLLLLGLRLSPAEGVPASDFQCFWAASKVALTGEPRDVYDKGALRAAQVALHARAGAPTGCFIIYPPPSLLLFLPLALLPYTVSAVAWLAATAVAYALALRALLPGWAAVLPFFAFPAAFLNAWYVQSGFLGAALLAAAAHLLAKRPVLAGVGLGCLVYKPHLGLVVPLALAAAGRCRAFAAATATVLASAAAATAALGPDIWPAYLTSVEDAGRWLEATPGRIGHDMASVFAAVRLASGRVDWAYAAQAIVAAGACAAMVAALRRRPGARAEGALMAAAIPLATPYLFHYDQAILAVPLAWVLAEGRRSGFLPWEWAAFWALLASPALAHAAVVAWDAPLAPLISVGVFAAVLRRVRHLPAGAAAPPAMPSGALVQATLAPR